MLLRDQNHKILQLRVRNNREAMDCIDLFFIAADDIDAALLLDEDRLFDTYLLEVSGGYAGIESAYIDTFDNLKKLLLFVFKTKVFLSELTCTDTKSLYDLTHYKGNFMTLDELESSYSNWLLQSSRKNTMDEYGNLLGILAYIQRNQNKKHLVLITEKRKHS